MTHYLPRGAGNSLRAACVIACVSAEALTHAATAQVWADDFKARLAILALIETLNTDLLTSHSATATLTNWCAIHHMATQPKIIAHLLLGIAKPITPEQRRRLDIGPNEPVIYRRVELVCGEHILSQADNWYVPSRLTPTMNKALQSTDLPFGSVIAPLHPRRLTISVENLWQPLPRGWEMASPPADHPGQKLSIPPLLFEHRALVYAADGKPISEVAETYRKDILDFERP